MHRQVAIKAEKGVFETVTGTFRKLSFTKDSPHSKTHLALMNIPHWLAKRDAAYDGAVYLIKNSLSSHSPPEIRQYAYTRILALLNLAEKAHKRIQTNLFNRQKKNQVDYIGVYFNLLAILVQASSSLLDADILIASSEDNSISEFVGPLGAKHLQYISITCMEDEKKLHDSVISLIKTVEQLLEKEEIRSKKALEKIDRDRYEEAFAELQDIYIHGANGTEELQ